MLVNLKKTFTKPASEADFSTLHVRVRVAGTKNPARLYNQAGDLINASGLAQLSTSGNIDVWVNSGIEYDLELHNRSRGFIYSTLLASDPQAPSTDSSSSTGGALGPYATTADLEAAYPGASNVGKHASIGSSAPYVDYVSNGTWIVADTNTDTDTAINANIVGKTVSAPAIIRGSADGSTFPGVLTGVLPDSTARTANGVALQAFLDWCDTNGKYAELPPSRYEYIAQATQNGRNTGLHAKYGVRGLVGCSPDLNTGTVLVQYATNHPVLTIGDVSNTVSQLQEGGKFGGFTVGHGSSQTGQTSADGLLLGRIWKSTFDDMYVSSTLDGTNHANCGIRIGLGLNQFFFQNRLGNIVSKSGQAHLLRMDANSTGNWWDAIYLGGVSNAGGAGTFGARLSLTAEPCFINTPEFGTVGQFNIEWCDSSTQTAALRVDNCNGFHADYVHFEGDKVNNFNGRVIINTASKIFIDQMNMLDIWFGSAATGTPSVISGYGGAGVGTYEAWTHIEMLQSKWNGSGYNAEAVASVPFQLVRDDATIVGRQPKVTIAKALFTGHTGALTIDASTAGAAPGASGAITEFANYKFNKNRSTTEDANITMANTNLTVYGQHRSAKVTHSAALTANRTLTLSNKLAASGAGSASARNAGDILEVHRIGAGAFDLIVNNELGTALYTFSGAASAATAKSFEWSGTSWSAL